MAALHEIARQYAEEIRDGIAWVIIWKTGRSWHAESVWLNQDSDTFELEDLSTATEILEQDPNAVMVNGYYCGHFGENMTIAELEAGILWHYEGGCNLLKDSTAFPPEPIPRPENLPADMPWYGKETTEEPDPYIFDGYMSVEDYEKRQQLIAADQARSDPLPDGTDYDGVKFTDLEVRSDMDAPDKLKKLGLYPADDYESDEYFWLDSNGERVIYRGGNWISGAGAGVFYLGGYNSRSHASASLGFRAACVRFICDSDTLDDLDSDKKQPEPKKRSILAPDFIGRIKQALARQFQKLYEAAHGEDPEGFAELAEKATDEELAKAAKLSATLAQVNAAVDMYELTAKQLKLAATTSITIKTEVNDHE